MQKRKSSNRRRCREARRLTTEALESRQLMAADLGMPGSSDLQSAMLARIQSSGFDVSAMVSRIQSSGISSQQLQAMRQQIAGNPTAQAMVQQRMQAALSQTEPAAETTESEQLQPEEAVTPSVDSSPATEATGSLVDPAEQEEVSSSDTSVRTRVRDEVAERIGERFDGEVPEELQERIAARREDGPSGGPLSRLREMADRTDVDPSEFVVRDADGAIDREATRENVRERIEGSELAETIRDRVEERFDGEVPEELRERITDRIAAGGGDASVDSLESAFATPAVSPLGRSDVNRDGALSPLDALLVINVMNNSASEYSEMADVNSDGQITPIDALQIVNAMNDRSAAPAPVLREAAIDRLLAGGLEDDDEEDGIFSLPV